MSSRYRSPVDPEAANNPHAIALRMIGSGQRVLEVGCSVGHVTEHLVDRGNDVVGIELDPEAADQARAFASRVHVLDLDHTPATSVETGPFDVVLLGDVIEHLRNPVPPLIDLGSLLAPGGRLVISVPNVAHIDVRLMLLQGRWQYQPIGLLDATHLRWFTKASLRSTLAEAGFVATKVERVVMGLGVSGLPISPEIAGPDVIRFIEADPEAYTWQFVVEARRTANAASDILADVLADDHDDGPAIAWPQLHAERESLEQQLAAARADTDALRREVALDWKARLRRRLGR